MKFIVALGVFCLLQFMVFGQTEKEVQGKYLLITQISKAKTLTKTLNLKKKGYESSSQNPFKGDFTEKGTWSLSNDTLTLICTERKVKQTKDSNYNVNFRKQDFEYNKKELFLIRGDQICSVHVTNRGEGYCFMKQ